MKKRNKLEARVLLHLSPSRVAAGASLGADWNSGCMNSSQYDMPYSRFGTTGPSWHPPQSHLRNEGTTGSLGMLYHYHMVHINPLLILFMRRWIVKKDTFRTCQCSPALFKRPIASSNLPSPRSFSICSCFPTSHCSLTPTGPTAPSPVQVSTTRQWPSAPWWPPLPFGAAPCDRDSPGRGASAPRPSAPRRAPRGARAPRGGLEQSISVMEGVWGRVTMDGKPFVNWAPRIEYKQRADHLAGMWNLQSIALVRYAYCLSNICMCMWSASPFFGFPDSQKTALSGNWIGWRSRFPLSPIATRRMFPSPPPPARSKYFRSDHGFRGVLTAPAGSPIASWRPPGEDIFSPCASERIMSRYRTLGLQSYLLRRWDWGGC